MEVLMPTRRSTAGAFRPILRRVETRADFVHQDAAIVGRAVSEVPVDDADRFKAAQGLAQLHRREGPEPAQIHVADLLSLLAQAPNRRACWSRHRTNADQDRFRVVGHELVEIVRRGVAIAENIVEFFRNLPQKQCMECGEPIKEQHECYGNKCDGCMHPSKL